MTDQENIYRPFLQPRGPAYRDSQVDERLSHYYDPIDTSVGRLAGNSHIHGDASAEVQAGVMDALVDASQRAGLDNRQAAYVLATARFESGFNPDAAAGPTSAYGVGQFVKKTGHSYGIADTDRGDLTRQAEALVAYYQDNAARAHSRGEGDEYIYAYHHDGVNASADAIALSREHVMPYVPAFERFVEARQQIHDRLPIDPEFHNRTHVSQERQQQSPAQTVFRQGSQGEAVSEIQTQLSQLGYTGRHGELSTDGHFGPETQRAVEAFQRDHELVPDGVVGNRTREAIANALTQDTNTLLDNPAHPDHALYQEVRGHVHRLDQDMGRMPDVHSDNLAAGLAVAARQNGLMRVDQIALSEDGSRLWAAQRPPGVRDHFLDQFASVSTQAAMTSLAQTSAQWPQAMEQYQQLQSQQQTQQQSQAQELLQPGPILGR